MKRADTGSMQGSPAERPTVPGRALRRRAPRRVRALAGAGVVLAAAGALAGCNAMSPATIIEPYAASDGVNVELGDTVLLRNVLVVATEKGGRGSVVGTIVNQGAEPVQIELAAQLGPEAQPGQTVVRVPAGGNVLIGPQGLGSTEMTVDDLPVAPGEVIEMSAASSGSGVTYFKAPVLPAEGEYASLTAAPTTAPPTPSETPSGSASEGSSDDASATGEPTGEATGEATGEPTEEPTETP